jgi:hypothetical protein
VSESVIIERNEDMSPMGRLALVLQEDGDVIVAVRPDPEELHQNSVEFCQPFSGGGRSPATIRALRALAVAMKKDNAQRPIITDPRRQPPPFDPKRYQNEAELRDEIDRLRAELAEAKAELTALKEPPKVVVRPAFYVNPDDYPEEDMESP